jgi:hypothetical protein
MPANPFGIPPIDQLPLLSVVAFLFPAGVPRKMLTLPMGAPVIAFVTVPRTVKNRGVAGARIVMSATPLTPWYVAVMCAMPGMMAVTTPTALTAAMSAAGDCQVACDVTSCFVPFEKFAVAENCAVVPIAGAVPTTLTDVTVGITGDVVPGEGVEDELLHAHADSAHAVAYANDREIRCIATFRSWKRYGACGGREAQATTTCLTV